MITPCWESKPIGQLLADKVEQLEQLEQELPTIKFQSELQQAHLINLQQPMTLSQFWETYDPISAKETRMGETLDTAGYDDKKG